jgi:D-3-phosphoglycerate dehydrogenase / 2-oxoglutarate reductase
MTFQVVITDCPWEDNSIERGILEAAGAEVVRAQCTTPEQVIAHCSEADALLVGWAPINRKVVSELHRCRLAMRYGTGYDNIDVPAATAAGIAVGINADYCVDEVAMHALSLLLSLHRQLPELMHSVRSGVWDPMAVLRRAPGLHRQTVGIVGLGRIGRRFLNLVKPLTHRVLVFDPVLQATGSAPDGFEWASLDGLLTDCDYISIHAPLTAETHHLFNPETLARMKPGASLINCARGPIVDEAALTEALRTGRLGGAALDVFEREPLPTNHPLREFPNVIITPHAAWFSADADYRLRANPAEAIVRFFRGEPVPLLNQPVAKAAS